MKRLINYFSLTEKIIFISSILIISLAFFIFDGNGYVSFIASIIGVISLILNAKGNFIGQIVGIIFCTLYAIISFSYQYYGEVITYFGMTMPFAIVSLVSWIKNPYKDNKTEVSVNHVRLKEILLFLPVAIIITILFYFILKYFETSNLIFSTISVLTSTVAVYLTFRRSPYFALAYSLNDIVLIVLWTLASIENITYVSVVGCFIAFFINDIYGYIAWERMKKRQNQ
ncbi:MAG: nicotinamide mononucleotide transporter [Bacilli bacterium]|nr:nicotinamide mononucleotide transporter [Bacilli bacterium]